MIIIIFLFFLNMWDDFRMTVHSDINSLKLCREWNKWKFDGAKSGQDSRCWRDSHSKSLNFGMVSFAKCCLVLSWWKMTPLQIVKGKLFSWNLRFTIKRSVFIDIGRPARMWLRVQLKITRRKSAKQLLIVRRRGARSCKIVSMILSQFRHLSLPKFSEHNMGKVQLRRPPYLKYFLKKNSTMNKAWLATEKFNSRKHEKTTPKQKAASTCGHFILTMKIGH